MEGFGDSSVSKGDRYACGVSDAACKVGAADEAVALADVTAAIKTFVELLLQMNGAPKRTEVPRHTLALRIPLVFSKRRGDDASKDED